MSVVALAIGHDLLSYRVCEDRLVATMRSPPLLTGQNTCTVDSFQKEPEKVAHLADPNWSQALGRIESKVVV
jgi:hypothetical protein